MNEPITPLTINKKTAANVEILKALLKLVDGVKTNLTEAEQIGVETFKSTGRLRATPIEKGSLEAYDQAVTEVGKNLATVLEEVGRIATVVEQIHICMSETKVAAGFLIEHQTEALRASAN